MNPAILRIKEAAPLPQVGAEYVKLTKRGTSWQGLCPFHSEKTGSLRIHQSYFKCFGCDAKGDVITFLSRIEGVSVGAAIKLLSDRTGIPLDSTQKPRTRLQRAYDAQEQAFAEWWHSRQLDDRGRILTFALEQEEPDWEWIEAMGSDLICLRNAPRHQWVALALRCATAEDRADWAWLQALPRILAGAA